MTQAEWARIDRIAFSQTEALPGTEIDVGVTEAETLVTTGPITTEDVAEASGGQVIVPTSSTGFGEATGEFIGTPGTYTVTTRFFNESDGAASFIPAPERCGRWKLERNRRCRRL